MSKNRVVITGIGGICSLGSNIDEIWNNILAYQVGYKKLPMDDSSIVAKFFGKIEKPISIKKIPKKIAKNLPRFAKLGMAAAIEAMESAFGTDPLKTLDKYYSPFERGVIFGTGWGGG
ncbi:beta-ketoacyl synthase N-terminal-like domain-containing protein [Acinetobacter pittii]|uniref:beta-ketoacyl synthase N-terminal-like domain-containing protein n=2 Tax=Moraxellaceae TaxID=468 RepID=UPI000AAEBA98|nr:beta-ketoacyl synthase N-terminal-like domain-containing protein [Acinetobacter pittii]